MYHNGHGVRANFQEYVKWLKKAIDNDGFFYPQLYSQKEQEERAKKALKYGSITEKYKAASVLQDEDAFRKVLKMFPRNLMVKNDELIELKKENNDKKIKELLAEDFRCIPFYVLLHIRDRLKPREPIQLSGEELDLLNKFIEQAKNSPKPHLFYLQIAKLYTGYGGYPENPELAEKYLNLAIGNNNEYNARYRKALYYLSKKDIASARRVADELLSEGYCVFFYNMPDDIKPHYMNKYNENHANFIKELKQGK